MKIDLNISSLNYFLLVFEIKERVNEEEQPAVPSGGDDGKTKQSLSEEKLRRRRDIHSGKNNTLLDILTPTVHLETLNLNKFK